MKKKKTIEDLLMSIFKLVNEAKATYENNIQRNLVDVEKKNFPPNSGFIQSKIINQEFSKEKDLSATFLSSQKENFINQKRNLIGELEHKLEDKFLKEFKSSRNINENQNTEVASFSKLNESELLEAQFKIFIHSWIENNLKSIIEEIFSKQIKKN